MERDEAIARLRLLRGTDLVALASQLEVGILGASGKKNKGWAGHTLEAYLELPRNSSRAPNFGSWELKSVSLKRAGGGLRVKETMAITMLDPREVALKTFYESHLYTKLRKLLIVVRIWENLQETSSEFVGVYPFDLDDHVFLSQIEADYELIRSNVLQGRPLSGAMGTYIQPRTKGAGGSAAKTRAFYARASFVRHVIASAEENGQGLVLV
ncbi:MvaI/BcnI family restriction endonuclease [Deinococcus sp. RL]|uniref:MvaI/BcnI family restriction endonuclease n=1 Tax=Deinococcus sp. RL TaxID=1489678 RepID=UPI0009E0245C|nr:MvaI/BcnI family restriction endonuclease [Deinococcus sp. RL]